VKFLDDALSGIKNLAESTWRGAENTVSGVIGAVGDFFTGDVGTQPVPVPEFVQQVRNGKTTDWYRGVAQAKELSEAHKDVDHTVSGLLTRLEASWTGAGSDAARQKIRKFRDVTADAATAFTGNGTSLKMVAGSFDTAKHAMAPMPPRPDKSVVDVLTPWTTDTEAAIGKYNDIAAKNLALYRTYEAQAGAGSAQLTIDYGRLGAFDGGAISITDTPARKKPRGTGPDAPTPGFARADLAPPPPPTTTPGSHDTVDGGAATVLDQGERSSGPIDRGEQDTTAAGFVPSPTSTGFGPGTSPAPAGAGAGLDGGSPGFGAGGVAHGVGGAPPGNRTGTGDSGRGGTAVPGRGVGPRGPAGIGGTAPGAIRGKAAEEDQERRRKYVLDTTLFDEDGTEITDPVHGLPAIPPTIGA
jgi:hypothetical protein